MFFPNSQQYPNDLINLNNIHLNIINPCGYCTKPSKIHSNSLNWLTNGFTCPLMSCETYQMLLERGWRRCGTYYYRPEASKCCCRPYMIRLEVQKYRIRSSHLQSLKRFRAFLKQKDLEISFEEHDFGVKSLLDELFEEIRVNFKVNSKELEGLKPQDREKLKVDAPILMKKKKFHRTCNLIWMVYSLNQAFLKEEEIDFKAFRKKISCFIEQFMLEKQTIFKVKCHQSGYLSIKLKENIKKKEFYELFQDTLNDPNSGFEIKLVPAEYEEESYEIYHKYSEIIHKITESRSSYRNFLCQQALKASSELKNGCFHMKYYLNKKLIAVGVIDILPKGLSSVYFFYDPDYKRNSLGVLGCLREIFFVMKKREVLPKFQYYYMGYYIQTSKKMKYKGDFEPSELLCPKSMKWVPLNERTKGIINKHKEDPGLIEEEGIKTKEKEKDKEEGEILTKEYFLNRKKLFYYNEWIGVNELQRKYVNLFLERIVGLGRCLGRELIEKVEFTIV